MAIEEVIKRATINFPKSLTLEETEDLLEHIAKVLPANINYQISQYRTLHHGYLKDGEFSNIEGTLAVSGSIMHRENSIAMDAFSLEPILGEDYSKVAYLRFSVIPGYDELKEYHAETIQLWDDTKEVIDSYFNQEEE